MVKEIREPQLDNELGPIVQEIQPKVLNRLYLEENWIENVQLGFKKVMQEPGGTAYQLFWWEVLFTCREDWYGTVIL